MKSILLVFCAFCLKLTTFSQDTATVQTKYWRIANVFGLNATQSAFVNWAAGGRNNISALAFINSNFDYNKNSHKWTNEVRLALGGVKYFDQGGMQKTDDQIMINSNYGYKIKGKWYFSVLADFRTQFMDGFIYPNDSIPQSRFMAPGYGLLALGIDYTPNAHFTLLMSPATGKFTFVNDERLANAGAYGVRAAEYDGLGNLVRAGSRLRPEIGAYIKATYKKEIMKNILLQSRLELFSNYLENPENIDVNAEVILNFKVNSWFSATLQFNLIYDDDIHVAIKDAVGNTYLAPRTQFKQVLGLGIQYRLANFKEEKK
jgi:hypothetical protein